MCGLPIALTRQFRMPFNQKKKKKKSFVLDIMYGT